MNMDAFENEKGKEKRSAWRDAEAFGIDMSLLDENLRKTPEERIQQQSDAQNAILELRKAMKESLG